MTSDSGAEALMRVFEKYRHHPDFLLCDSFTDINTPGQLSGDTVLHIAVRSRSEADVLELLELGADPNVPGDLGKRPLHEAETPSVVGLLRKWGADPSLKDEYGRTRLYYLRLLADGADISEMERALTCRIEDL